MPSEMRTPRPVVTGMGAVTCLGLGVRALWNGLLEGRSGLHPVRGFASEFLRTPLCGEIELSDAMRREAQARSCQDRLSFFLDLALEEALADAKLDNAALAGRRSALVLGISLGMSLVPASLDVPFDAKAPVELDDDLARVAARLRGRYPAFSEVIIVTTACASGTHAIGMALDLVAGGEFDIVVCGGADTIDRIKYLGHTALSTLSPTTPTPFARDRDGTIFGEGAGILVVEPRHAARRAPLATLSGAGYSTDIHHLTAPDPGGRGAIEAMRQAIADADIDAKEIEHINLHGSGTPVNDEVESRAIAALFRETARDIACTTIKPAIGHTAGAAGALEAIATVLAIAEGVVPPVANVVAQDPELPIRIVCGAPERRTVRNALNNSFGFGGANGVVLFQQPRKTGT